MRSDIGKIESDFDSISASLKKIASDIEISLIECFQDFQHLDRINSRVKTKTSFLDKASKEIDGQLKYKTPFKEIQDVLGTRIIVYYKSDVDRAMEVINKWFSVVEHRTVIPDNVNKFGYEGVHFICFIPSTIYSEHKSNLLIPDFFELQIKTLYQHAWSQSEHGLGYKAKKNLSSEMRENWLSSLLNPGELIRYF